MKTFIVAVPLFDAKMAVQAYWLRAQSGEKALTRIGDFRSRGDEMLTPGLDLVEKVGVDSFATDVPLFMDFTRFHLLAGRPCGCRIPCERLVCVIPGGLPCDEELLERCRHLQSQGYTLAINGYPPEGASSPYLDYANYLIFDVKAPGYETIIKTMAYRYPNMRLVVTDVPDEAAFDKVRKDRDTRSALLHGSFYNRPVTRGAATISPLKVNVLNLLKNVNTEDFELSESTKIIERDPALSISLLRFINSSGALSRKVDSIQSAVTIMGQQEIRRWATVAIQVSLAADRPSEVTRLSLIRAQFAENLAGAFELGVFQQSLFITGLFSLLDVILEQPMAVAIQDVAVNQRVHDALVNKSGMLYPVMELIYAYEKADWDTVTILMIRSNIDVETVSTAFVNALKWYQKLLNSLSEPPVEAAGA